jgi:hypothetical protein
VRNPLRFFVDLLDQPRWVVIWVYYLMAINLLSVAFVKLPLAQLILFTFGVSATLMMALYSRFGMEKILGLGHILWLPLVVFLATRIPALDGGFQVYVIVLTVTIAISLAFDIADVWIYFRDRSSR